MKLKFKSNNKLIIRDIISNDIPCCDFCGVQKGIGVFSTQIGRKVLCSDCVKEYSIVLDKNDYLFSNNLTLTDNNEILLNNEKIELIDENTSEPICLTMQV